MIVTAGEALIDLIVAADGHVEARLGGALYNTARAVARIGVVPAAYLGRLGSDGFAARLRAGLSEDGVRLAVPDPADVPTTLAIADLDTEGVPRFAFYLDGTSAPLVEPAAAVLPAGTTVLYTGALGLVMEPSGTAIEHLARTLPDDVLLILDPNCRPSAIAARQPYLGRVGRLLRRSDVVKTSTADLEYLYLGASPEDAARGLLGSGTEGDPGAAGSGSGAEGGARAAGSGSGAEGDAGAAGSRPRAVIVTDGAAPVRVFTAGVCTTIEVPAAEIVDTVGAGDAFGGAFAAWWAGHGLGRAEVADHDLVRAAAGAAIEAAVITCTRRGADPPTAADLAGQPGWEWLPG